MNRPAISDLLLAIIYDPINGTFFWTHHEVVYVNLRGKETGLTGSKGHRKIVFQGIQLKAHHVAWAISYGYWPVEIDHEDNNRANNRLSNLREATRLQNQSNRSLSLNNSSGYKGVTERSPGKYEAKITVNGKYLYLGKFTDPLAAAKAYDIAAIKHHGKFARTNKLLGLI